MSALPLAFRLAGRELRGGLKGFRLFLACLALGVGAIATVGSISTAIKAALEQDKRAILGGDVALRLTHQELSPEQRRYIERDAIIARATTLRSIARTEDDKRRALIEFKAVDGHYPLYGALVIEPPQALGDALGRRDGVWGAVVETGVLDRLDAKLGERIRVGGAAYEIRAVLRREPDRLSGARGIDLGPRVLAAQESLAETGLVRPGSLILYLYRLKLTREIDPETWTTALNRAFPGAPWVVQQGADAAPALGRFIDRTTQFLALVGLTALLVGGVGVSNAVRHFLAGKTASIATLKCLGASSRLIFALYLIQILVMAGLGILIGLGFGAVVPILAAETLSNLLPIAIEVGVYGAPLAIAAAFGALTALAFTIWPIARACEIQPGSLFRDLVAPARRLPRPIFIAGTAVAIGALAVLAVVASTDRRLALWFVVSAAVAFLVFGLAGRAIAALAGLAARTCQARIRLALANLHRPGAATGGIVLSLGLGLTVLVAIALIHGNLVSQMSQQLPARAPAFYFIDIQPDQVAPFEATVRGIPGVLEMQRVPMLRGRISAINGVPADEAKVAPSVAWVIRGDRGVTWATAPPAGTKLVNGAWWPADYRGPPLISFDAAVAAGFGVAIGDEITVNVLGRDIAARIANLRRIEWDSLRMNFLVIFSPGVIEAAPQTHLATVRTEPSAEAPLERAVATGFANVTAIRVKEVLANIAESLGRLGNAVQLAASLTLIAGVLVLGGAIAASHRRRVYDAVILKVLGATRWNIAVVYAVEYGVLGLATAVVAGLLGTAAAWVVVTEVMQLDWTFLPWVVVVTSVLATSITLGLGLMGTLFALGAKAAPLLRNP